MSNDGFTANSESELVKTLQTIIKKNKFQGFTTGMKVEAGGLTFGKETKNHAKYGWTNAHSLLNYAGERFDVKTPKLLGSLGIRFLRPQIDKLFNDSFLIYQNAEKSFNQEKETYKFLNEENFPTFKIRQDIVPASESHINKNTLITQLVEKPYHLIDAIKESNSNEEKQLHIRAAATLLGNLHSLDVLSGDPALQQFLYDCDGNLLLYDFETKMNPKFTLEQGKTNDFVQFTLNAVGQSKLSPQEVSKAAMQGYQSSASQNGLLPDYMVTKFPKSGLFRELSFTKPIHAIDVETEQETYRAIIGLL